MPGHVSTQARIEQVLISRPDPGDIAVAWIEPWPDVPAEDQVPTCRLTLAPGTHIDVRPTDDLAYLDRLRDVLAEVRVRLTAARARRSR
ncbi:hypothetical protein [Marinitenerispora sediminis]|nr:hypothetical protein [Marinitenerispora sediminis]